MVNPTSVTARWVIPIAGEGRSAVVVERSADGISLYAGKQSAITVPRDSIREFVTAVESAEWYVIPGDRPPVDPNDQPLAAPRARPGGMGQGSRR